MSTMQHQQIQSPIQTRKLNKPTADFKKDRLHNCKTNRRIRKKRCSEAPVMGDRATPDEYIASGLRQLG